MEVGVGDGRVTSSCVYYAIICSLVYLFEVPKLKFREFGIEHYFKLKLQAW